MSFIATMAQVVFDSLPFAIVYPFPIFIIITGFLIKRRRRVEERLLGCCTASFWRELTGNTLAGIVAGFAGSLILLTLGIAIKTDGFFLLLMAALLLMLLDLRYLCLAYAGGLLSLISLLIGRELVYIPGVLGLVAVLHLTESALILSTGDQYALPVYLKRPEGTVGGFLLQKIWPVPLLVLTVMAATGQTDMVTLPSPGWWPLIPMEPAKIAAGALIYSILPVTAALGYGDLAVQSTPRRRSAVTAGLLCLYSLILLALSVAAAHNGVYAWLAALFSPIGHELVLISGRKQECCGEPIFAPAPVGAKILAVRLGSLAAAAGLRQGDIIVGLNGEPIDTKRDFLSMVRTAVKIDKMTILPHCGGEQRQYNLDGAAGDLGLVMVPDPDEPAQIQLRSWSLLPRRRRNS